MKRRTLLGAAIVVAGFGLISSGLISKVRAEGPPIKIGMSMPQTGHLPAWSALLQPIGQTQTSFAAAWEPAVAAGVTADSRLRCRSA